VSISSSPTRTGVTRFNDTGPEEIRQWYINPVEFFRVAFATDSLPKPDTTTIAGRRIYYSHIDGDGWNNYAQLEEYRRQPVLTSRVIMEKAIKPYPDLPVSLTVIAAEVDPRWAAVKESEQTAREFFSLPQVEAGTHTYSHPFYWEFFEDKNWKKEEPFLALYQTGSWENEGRKGWLRSLIATFRQKKSHASLPQLPSGYHVPRAYANQPFNLHTEIGGSIAKVQELLPKGKKVALVTWPGNCSPFEEAVRLTREAGVQNINGGDSRFDMEYPTYASLAPIGRPVGKERQIYASNSNENTYTELWSGRYHGYRYLQETLKNSETPIRFKPINIYYHIYAGEKEAALKALIENLDYARSQEIAPLTTSEFTRLANGFYTTRFIPLGPNRWEVANRGELQTIRFDHSAELKVNFEESKGVVGERHHQGSLYVYLDAAEANPIISLMPHDVYTLIPEADVPYLLQARWKVSALKRRENGFDFAAQGFGAGEMVWRVPVNGPYVVNIPGEGKKTIQASRGELRITLPAGFNEPQHVSVMRYTNA
jgi:polysaccharide biosynthesis protein PelA